MARAKPQKPVESTARSTKASKAAAAPLKPRPSPVKAPSKVQAKPPAKAAKAVGTPKVTKVDKAEKADKARKPKLMRDSFTIPKPEYEVIDSLKERAARGGYAAKKSELLRAGIKALAAMDDAAFMAAVNQVPAIKTGRPAKA